MHISSLGTCSLDPQALFLVHLFFRELFCTHLYVMCFPLPWDLTWGSGDWCIEQLNTHNLTKISVSFPCIFYVSHVSMYTENTKFSLSQEEYLKNQWCEARDSRVKHFFCLQSGNSYAQKCA